LASSLKQEKEGKREGRGGEGRGEEGRGGEGSTEVEFLDDHEEKKKKIQSSEKSIYI